MSKEVPIEPEAAPPTSDESVITAGGKKAAQEPQPPPSIHNEIKPETRRKEPQEGLSDYRGVFLETKTTLGINRIMLEDDLYRKLNIINFLVGGKSVTISHYVNNILRAHLEDNDFIRDFLAAHDTVNTK